MKNMAHNTGLAKVVVQWLTEALLMNNCFYKAFVSP